MTTLLTEKQILTRKQRTLLAGIVMVGLLLRVLWLDKHSLWLDEITSILVSQAPIADILQGRVFDNHTPPLYYALLKMWGLYIPLNETGLRLFSALVDSCNLVLFWLLCRQIFAVPRALMALAAYALSPFLLYYAQEGRMYSLMVFWVLAYTLVFGKMLVSRNSLFRWALPAGVLLALGVYTHYYFAFFAIGLNVLGLILNRRSRTHIGALVFSGAFGIILFLPWVHIVSRLANSGGQSFREFIFLVLPYSIFRFIVGYAVFPLNLGTKVDYVKEIIHNLPSVLLVYGTIVFMVKDALVCKDPKRIKVSLCLAWVALAPALIAVVLSIKSPLLSERYLLVSMPFFILLLFSQARLTGSRAVVILFFLLMAWGDLFYFFSPDFGKAQWRDAAFLVAGTARDSDLILIDPSYSAPVLEYYLKQTPGGVRLLGNLANTADQKPLADLHNYERVILVSSGYKIGRGTDLELGRSRQLKEKKVFPLETGIVVSSWDKQGGTIKK